MRFSREHGRLWSLVLLALLFWGTQHPVLKVLADSLSPIVLCLWRFVLTALVLYPFAAKQAHAIPWQAKAQMMSIGFFGFGVYSYLGIVGIHRSTAVNSAILVNVHPLLTVFFAPLLICEKSSKQIKVWTIVGFLGVIVVLSEGFGQTDLLQSSYFYGNCLLVLSAVFLSLYTVYLKPFIDRFGALAATHYAIIGVCILFVGMGAATIPLQQAIQLTSRQFLLLLYTAWATTAFGMVVWFRAVAVLGAARGTNFVLLIPILNVIFSRLFLKESVPWYALLGAGITLAAIFFAQLHRRQDRT